MIDPGEEQLILPDDLEPVEMGRMLPEDQEAARKTLLEENGGLCRVGWPLVLMITNAYVGAGCLPTYVGLAILAANKEPDFVSGLEVPHVVWAINTIILVGSIIGMEKAKGSNPNDIYFYRIYCRVCAVEMHGWVCPEDAGRAGG